MTLLEIHMHVRTVQAYLYFTSWKPGLSGLMLNMWARAEHTKAWMRDYIQEMYISNNNFQRSTRTSTNPLLSCYVYIRYHLGEYGVGCSSRYYFLRLTFSRFNPSVQSVSTHTESRDLRALMWRFSRVTITAGRPDWFGGGHTLHGGRRQQPIISSSVGIWYRDLLMLARGDNDGWKNPEPLS